MWMCERCEPSFKHIEFLPDFFLMHQKITVNMASSTIYLVQALNPFTIKALVDSSVHPECCISIPAGEARERVGSNVNLIRWNA
jgi:hypothetical protein